VWIEQHKSKWRIRDLVDGRKVTVQSGIPTKTIANQVKKRLEIEQTDYGPVKHGADKIVFRAWAEDWWTAHERTFGSSATAKSERSRFHKHIIGRLGHLPVRDIDAAAVRHWIGQLAEPDDAEYDPLAPKTIKNTHAYLYMCLEAAVAERIIRSNPCGHSKLPKWEAPQVRYLTQKELAEVIAEIPLQWRAVAVFIAATGCRVGEALGIKQRCVDVLGAKVRFETQLRYEGGQYVDVPLKTKASRRTVGIPPSLVSVLAERADLDGDAYVFTAPRGGPIYYDVYREMWQRALKETPFAGVRIHDLRHTHAAHLISKGRPLTVVQRRLGHSSIQVTSDVYGGLLPEVEDDTAAAVETFIEGIDLAGIGGGIVGEPDRAQRPTTTVDASEGNTEPQVEADSAL
jgi:integrase